MSALPDSTPLEALRILLPAGVFSTQEMAELASRCTLIQLNQGEVLIREGEPSDSKVYFLLSGQVSVTIQERFILNLSRSGDTIGEMGLISSAPRSATVTADALTRLLVVNTLLTAQEGQDSDYKFRYFFSRLFNSILTEKLRRTSDRARLYEDMVSRTREAEQESANLQEDIAKYLREISMYTHMVNSAGDAILVTDVMGRVLTANPATTTQFGLESSQIAGHPIDTVVGMGGADGAVWKDLAQQLTPDQGWVQEVTVQTPQGRTVPADCRISLIRDHKGERLGYSVILRDITERKTYEDRILQQSKALEQAYQELQALERAKNAFLTLVSHELRTPISSIMAYSETLGIEGMVEPEDQAQFIAVIHQEAKKLADMVSKVLAISKLESGQMFFEFHPSDVGMLARNQSASYRDAAMEKGLRLIVEVPEVSKPVLMDEDQLGEALGLVLDNAIKYTAAGEVRLSVTQNENETLIQISDTGKGIHNINVQQLLEKFIRGDVKEARNAGLGLGLPLCFLIIQAHSGRLLLESGPNGGTHVSILLPFQSMAATA
ncbi:MAG: PAS domain S-box protein [Deltaproteobacteria bacterium]|nr:PAS domain S-box protein [Deltaproteobacteria bacterium]